MYATDYAANWAHLILSASQRCWRWKTFLCNLLVAIPPTTLECFYTIFTSYTFNDIYRYFSNTLDVAHTRAAKLFYLDSLSQSLAFLRKPLMLSYSHQHLQRCFYALCFFIFFTDSIHSSWINRWQEIFFLHNLFFPSEVNWLPSSYVFSLQMAIEEKSELTTSRKLSSGHDAVRFYARGLEAFTKKKRITSDRHAATKENLALSRRRAVDDVTNQPCTHDFANGWGLTKKSLCRVSKPEHAVRECEYAATTTGWNS